MAFATMPIVLPYVKGGRLKGVAVLGTGLSPAAPESPALAETAKWGKLIREVGIRVGRGAPAPISIPIRSRLEGVLHFLVLFLIQPNPNPCPHR